jgi:HPt (histidine-containing phosphotransfer) domain-containing protein
MTESTTNSHVDPSVLSALQDVMEDDYPALLDTFLNDSQSRLSALQAASDPLAISQAAHSFKGSSSNMGAVMLAQLCSRLEQCAIQPSDCDIQQLIREIGHEFSEVKPVYERERERYSA